MTAASATLDRVSPSLAQRLALLGAVALLAGVAAMAIVAQRGTSEGAAAPKHFRRVDGLLPVAGWSPSTVRAAHDLWPGLAPESLGVTHPVLPCGAKVVLRSGNKQVLSEVIDNKLVEPGRQLEVTEALARMLGIKGTSRARVAFRDDRRQLGS